MVAGWDLLSHDYLALVLVVGRMVVDGVLQCPNVLQAVLESHWDNLGYVELRVVGTG